ncbi:hypothetical protein B0H14DRAFT_3509659 [Mycena olivaceomarginata]|nr:hypothetical protein B0H14DRAFT_3509659 [Mycena olivaceomarginata]
MAASFLVALQPFPLNSALAPLPDASVPFPWLQQSSAGSFLVSFMAASFAAAFLLFPPVCLGTSPYLWDLFSTSGLRSPDL